jgi:hypothetical protein
MGQKDVGTPILAETGTCVFCSQDAVTLCIKDRIWTITIAGLLATDLEDVSPFASTGESLLQSEENSALITTDSETIQSDPESDTESSSPNDIFTVSVLLSYLSPQADTCH